MNNTNEIKHTIPDLIKGVKATECSGYLENEHRIFSVYTLQQRAIPFFNGMKPVQQRCLWKLRNTNKFEKVAKLAGQVMAIHPHGDKSIGDAINNMAGPYCNNVPFLDNHGTFGTMINPTAFGQPRYTSTKINSFAKDVVFKDLEIIGMKPSYDEEDIEPELMYPLVPLLLLNGIQGIASAYSTTILPRDLGEVITEQLKVLDGKEPINPLPYSKPIDCRAIRDPKNPNKYTFLGECEVINTSKAKITKLPFGMTHTKIVENLAKLVKSGVILDYTDKSKKTIDIIVDFKKASLKNKSGEFVARKLKLTSSDTESIIVLDAATSLKVLPYSNAATFIKDYTNWRISFYPVRYRRLIDLNLNEISRLNDIVLAIDNDLGGKAKEIKNKGDLVSFITEIGVKDIDYITSLPVYRFTEEEYKKAKDRIAELEEQNRDYADIIGDENRQKKIYKEELRIAKKKYAK